MLDPAMFPFCHEFYVVEKSIEVVVTINGNATAVRIDAVHNLQDDRYCTHAYTEECSFLQLADPVDDAEPRMPIRIWRIWTGFPWTTGQSADDVLRSALSFLRERCQRDAACVGARLKCHLARKVEMTPGLWTRLVRNGVTAQRGVKTRVEAG